MGMFDNDFLKGLEDIGKDAFGSVAKDAASFFKGSVQDTLVRIGPKPGGNVSPEELKAGITGSNPNESITPRSGVDSSALFNAVTAKVGGIPVLPLIIAGLGIGFLVFRRR